MQVLEGNAAECKCGVWIKVYTATQPLRDVVHSILHPEKTPTIADALGLPGVSVLCRTCTQPGKPDYDWLANRGECSMCRMRRRVYRRQVREVKRALARKASGRS